MEDIGSRLGGHVVHRLQGAKTRSIVRKSIWEDEAKELAEKEYKKGQKNGWLKGVLVAGPLSFVAGMVMVIAIVYG